jgi:4-diphosphocytidyl-2-C-methyl-D-erythritol kinase
MNQDPTGNHSPAELSARPADCPIDGGGLLLHAPAKINLNLLVAPARPDGFHPIDSIVAKVTLYDTIELRPRSDAQIVLDCNGADCGPAEQNLVMRAAKLLADGRNLCGVDIKLTKVIPPGAGLGGGSSDAAAALRGLNAMWGLQLDADRLSALAARLGSDVPLFLGPPAARLTGRGECVERLDVGDFTAVILMGGLMCSTVEVYTAYDRLGAAASEQIDTSLLATVRPSIWRASLRNDLTAAAMHVCPELALLHDRVAAAVDAPVHITGSGSAMFILCNNPTEARRAVAGLDETLQEMCVIAGLNPW